MLKKLRWLAVGGLFLLEGVIGGAHQRPGLNVLETHRFALPLVSGEFVGMDKTDHRQMFAGGLQVLAEGKDVGALRDQVPHR